jgi:hypothetical protein
VQTTRWNEVIENLKLLIDFISVFTNEGVDVHFLHGPSIENVHTSAQLITFMQQHNVGPGGGTPLTEKMVEIFTSHKYTSGKQINTYIFTDGVPDGGPEAFCNLVKKRKHAKLYPITIVACTDDDDAVGWMNNLDKVADYLDVVDDYASEMVEVKKAQIHNTDFGISIGTYILKILFGSFVEFYDLLDEKDVRSCSHNDFERNKKQTSTRPVKNQGCCVLC